MTGLAWLRRSGPEVRLAVRRSVAHRLVQASLGSVREDARRRGPRRRHGELRPRHAQRTLAQQRSEPTITLQQQCKTKYLIFENVVRVDNALDSESNTHALGHLQARSEAAESVGRLALSARLRDNRWRWRSGGSSSSSRRRRRCRWWHGRVAEQGGGSRSLLATVGAHLRAQQVHQGTLHSRLQPARQIRRATLLHGRRRGIISQLNSCKTTKIHIMCMSIEGLVA